MDRKVAGALAVVVAGLAISGCGGSGSKQPTQAEFARRADAACTRHENQTNALFKAAVAMKKAGASLPAIRAKLGGREPVYASQERAALDAVRPPEQLDAKYAQWRAGLRARDAMGPPEKDDGQAHAKRVALALKIHELALKLGFKACI